jgi:hypothetical protein
MLNLASTVSSLKQKREMQGLFRVFFTDPAGGMKLMVAVQQQEVLAGTWLLNATCARQVGVGGVLYHLVSKSQVCTISIRPKGVKNRSTFLGQ